MAWDYVIKQGDTAVIFKDTLTYSDGSSVNLTGATVNYVMRATTANNPWVNAAATITSATSPATVSYTPTTTDTSVTGSYLANWVVTFSGGTIQSFPTDGYIEVLVEDNLTTTGGAKLVTLGEAKDYLNFSTTDRTRDSKLSRLIDGLTPVIENITGPILQRIIPAELHDGGSWFLITRYRPIISVQSVVEYRGPVAYNLQQINSPDMGTIYSYEFEPYGRIVRRTVGGGQTPFPPGAQVVRVAYTAGYQQVPVNVRDGMLELLRINFRDTQERRPAPGSDPMDEDIVHDVPTGFLVPGRVRELLDPSRRHPSIA